MSKLAFLISRHKRWKMLKEDFPTMMIYHCTTYMKQIGIDYKGEEVRIRV